MTAGLFAAHLWAVTLAARRRARENRHGLILENETAPSEPENPAEAVNSMSNIDGDNCLNDTTVDAEVQPCEA